MELVRVFRNRREHLLQKVSDAAYGGDERSEAYWEGRADELVVLMQRLNFDQDMLVGAGYYLTWRDMR